MPQPVGGVAAQVFLPEFCPHPETIILSPAEEPCLGTAGSNGGGQGGDGSVLEPQLQL